MEPPQHNRGLLAFKTVNILPIQIPEMKREMSLFDLQTVGSWAYKNATFDTSGRLRLTVGCPLNGRGRRLGLAKEHNRLALQIHRCTASAVSLGFVLKHTLA